MKTIVITGCTRGLGLAMARDFSARGEKIVGCGRSAGKIASLQKNFGPGHDFTALDVSIDSEVRSWAARIVTEIGVPDLVINNAAIMARNAALWELAPAEFDAVVDVNVKGIANVIRHFVPAMIPLRRGVIVNFSSGWGRSTSPEVAAYCASKWAVEGLTQALAQELPAGMAAVSLNPGIIDTEMLRSCFGTSAGHYPTAEEWVKKAAPFLLAIKARDNGAALAVPDVPVD